MRGPVPGAEDCLLYLAETEGTDLRPTHRVAGLSLAERVFRAAVRAQLGTVIVWAPSARAFLEAAARTCAGALDVIVCATSEEWAAALSTLDATSAVPIVPAGLVVSPALLEDARKLARTMSSGPAAHVPAGPAFPKSGVVVASPSALIDRAAFERDALCPGAREAMPNGSDIAGGRARLVARVARRADLPLAERVVRRAIYKPSDPYLARFNRRLSIPVSIWLIRHTRLSANTLSILLIAWAALAAWLLSQGSYAWSVAGAMLSLVASILDGCDGEIARLTYTESKLGCWIETLGDYVYYLAILAGLSLGVVRSTGEPMFGWLGAGTLAGALLTFALLIVLRRSVTQGRPERLNQIALERFDRSKGGWARMMAKLSFVATRSTMPYGIAAFAVLDALPIVVILAFVGAQAYWISLAVKWGQLMPRHPAPAIVHLSPRSRSPQPDPRQKRFHTGVAVRKGTRS